MFIDQAYLADFTSDSFSRKHGVLFFHGFPGRTTRNEDLAEWISEKLEADCFALHYHGLGQSEGSFAFTACIDFGKKLVEQWSATYDKLHIVGHSWGGFVASHVFASLPSQKQGELLLINPVLEVFVRPKIEQIILSSLDEPKLGKAHNENPDFINELLDDTDKLRDSESALEILKKLKSQGKMPHLFLGLQDDVTPAQEILEQIYGLDLDVQTLMGDHWFTHSRHAIADLIATIIKYA